MPEVLKLPSSTVASRVEQMTCLALPPLVLGLDGLVLHTIVRSSSAQPFALVGPGPAPLHTKPKRAGRIGGLE